MKLGGVSQLVMAPTQTTAVCRAALMLENREKIEGVSCQRFFPRSSLCQQAEIPTSGPPTQTQPPKAIHGDTAAPSFTFTPPTPDKNPQHLGDQ